MTDGTVARQDRGMANAGRKGGGGGEVLTPMSLMEAIDLGSVPARTAARGEQRERAGKGERRGVREEGRAERRKER
eukprot:3696550-Rhodomonas_salina.2